MKEEGIEIHLKFTSVASLYETLLLPSSQEQEAVARSIMDAITPGLKKVFEQLCTDVTSKE